MLQVRSGQVGLPAARVHEAETWADHTDSRAQRSGQGQHSKDTVDRGSGRQATERGDGSCGAGARNSEGPTERSSDAGVCCAGWG